MTLSVHRFTLGVAIVAVALTATGCAPTAGPSSTPTVTASATPTPTPTPTPMAIAPLTGESFVADTLNHGVIMAKIDNHPDARPQFGLNHTDVLFEELVEGGLTRYVAVWHSDVPDAIGPVRSIRPMDPDIASPFKGSIAYSGGKRKFIFMMRDTQVENLMHGISKTKPYMYRTDLRAAPHNVILRAAKVIADRQGTEAPAPAFTFATNGEMPTALQFGKMREVLHARFSYGNQPSWVWDAENGVYKRRQANGEWDVDENGDVLTATNVIAEIVKESHEFGYVPKALVVGKGTAYVSTGGKTFPVKWTKKDRNSFTVFTFQDGNVVKLAPGNTWIELVPTSGKFWTDAVAK
ncbi:MAG: hypothetical protein RLZ72_419 [Actinomycetota bacterium]